MGASIHLIMAKGEKSRLLKQISGDVSLDEQTGCLITDGKGNRVSIEYQLGWNHREWAIALAHRICQKYQVIKGGWDSVGKLEPVAKFKKYRAFDFDIKGAKKYYNEYSKANPSDYPDVEVTVEELRRGAKIQASRLEQYKQLQGKYETKAKEIIHG
jgi:hypothetical protein